MRKKGYKIILFLVMPVFILLAFDAYAQRSIRKRTAVRMPYNRKMKIICPVFIPNEYPYQGIGIKVGDPFAITYKLYVSKFFGVEIAAGHAASFLYKKFYEDNFPNFESFDTLSYVSHSVKKDFVGQFRFMIQNEIGSSGTDWYMGAGYQFKIANVLYSYNDPDSMVLGMDQESEREQFFSGPDIFLGFEFANFSIPVTVFVEANMFIILDAKSLGPRFQAVAGVRYIF